MKKLANREYIEYMLRDNLTDHLGNYCTAMKLPGSKDMYCIVRNHDGVVLVVGKELKGYLDDIIYPQYDGVAFATGDFRLTSDRHGLICKWKDNSNSATINSNVDGQSVLRLPNGNTFVGDYADCLEKYYEWKEGESK